MESGDEAFLAFIIIWMIVSSLIICYRGDRSTTSPPETIIYETPQPQQDIETGQIKVLTFKDIKEEEEEGGCDSWLEQNRSCPNCRRSVD
ncbi:unnamed protein product [Microthlaspi erraticum]|uniref:RING-type domain-containing protein n=1 Tax=Microthlaspi erraticum TaxID=1685480 RepID=A0A6D2JZM8_9BRAS|nr:unnamed protein product [Microthlaspi erraticum]